jgi:quinol monooxygenase YgiN
MQVKDIEAFRALAEEVCKATKEEEGTVKYEFSLSADESTCHLYEGYADSAAAMVHMGNFNERFASRLMPIIQPTRLVMYGEPSDEVRAVSDSLGAIYMKPLAGFAR